MNPAAELQSAGEAWSRHAWGDVFAILAEADRHQPLDPEDLERLALAAHLIGKVPESDELWTRAHHAWLTRGDVPRAVRCVFWLGLDLVLSGEWSRSAGWMARAQRLLDAGQPDCVEEGYLLALQGLQSYFAGDAANAEAVSEQALVFATRFGDPDLMNFAMVTIGESLIRLERAGEGVQLLDEAMVAVTAGEVSPVVSALAYCAVIGACHEAFDLRRAREWTAELSRWCSEQHELVPYRGICLAHRVEIMRMHGDWADALDEANRACAWMRSGPIAPSADAAYYQLGELHRLRGEYDEAERAYREASRLGHTAQPGVALSLLATGDTGAAERAIRTALDAADDRTSRCRILPAYVEVMLAVDKVEDARPAAEELAAAAEALDSPLLNAVSGQAKGAVLLAAGEARSAQAVLGHAVATFRELDAPYEAPYAQVSATSTARPRPSSTSPTPAPTPQSTRTPWPRALLAAEDALLRDDGPQPSYSRVSGPAAGTVASHTARTLTDLADHTGTEQQHRDALTRWDPAKYKRVHALTHADLGDSLAAQARADEAVAAWTQALVLMEGMTSDRTRKAIASIRSTLAVYQRRRVPGAADLARRAREALA